MTTRTEDRMMLMPDLRDDLEDLTDEMARDFETTQPEWEFVEKLRDLLKRHAASTITECALRFVEDAILTKGDIIADELGNHWVHDGENVVKFSYRAGVTTEGG